METINRLQFRHHEEIFDTREDALKYICKTLPTEGGDGLAEQGSPYTRSLFAEPTILRYKNNEEENSCETCNKGPHIMLVIGADTNDSPLSIEKNKYCIIDIDKTEEEINILDEKIEKAIKSLTLIALSSETLNFYAEKTEEGTIVSGDVKTAETHVFDGIVKENNLMVTPEGLFIYVDLKYDESTETITFVVTNADGTLKKESVKLPNNYLVSGEYKKEDESIHLHMNNGDEVIVDCEQLIDEWIVEGEATNTPIVLTRKEVGPDEDHHHTEPWQDVLRADVRLADFIDSNILEKTSDGRYLFVDGKATNIRYYYNGELSNVSEQLDKFNKIKVSSDNDNIIWNRTDGFFANAKLEYISNKNKLIFTTSTVSGGTVSKEIQLNSVELFQNVYYDRNTEELVITYKDNDGNLKVIRIPISDMFQEWDVLNDAHSVKLVKSPHHVSGKDILTADVNISSADDNILVERGEGNVHTLYVRGAADNIKYGRGTVESALDELIAADETINEKLNQEIARSTEEDEKIENTIGDGFSTDAHETVTYKFEQLSEKVNSEADKLQNEIERSTEKDEEHDARLNGIDEAVDAISANTKASLKHVVNEDKSINVVEVDGEDGKASIVKVNLSEHEPFNTIRLEGDGLYNFIDLDYNAINNKLTLTTSDKNSMENRTKEIQLNSVSFIDDITYDPTTETIIITYHSGTEVKTVEISLSGIFQEWEVYNDPDSAVKLNRQRVIDGKDKLSAEVIITTAHTDNILENDHGALYVSNSGIAANAAAIRQLNADVNTLNTKIDTETARATNAENDLYNAIENERRRAESADTALYNAIEDERRRSEAADEVLEDAIGYEIQRATNAENNLSHLIDDEAERRANGDTSLRNDLQAEITRSTNKDQELTSGLTNEQTARIAEDQRLYQLIVDEKTRATEADTVLDAKINTASAESFARDSQLESKVSGETAAREAKDNIIEASLNSEIARSTAEDQRLTNAIDAEKTAREQGDAELSQQILDATLTFDDTASIDFTKTTGNVVTADVKLQEGDNIIKLGSGLYATVHLSYDPGTNKIKLVTSNGADEEIQLVGASLLEDLHYDSTNKSLVITYKDATGVEHTVQFGVSELFNEWSVDNPSENSAIELTKTPSAEPGGEDKISGRVLLTNLEDNAVKIVNNGLYVSSSAMTDAYDIAQCAKSELNVLEQVVIGHSIGQECGSGYTYEPNSQAKYINTATSFNNADFILDQTLKNVEEKVDDAREDVDCITSEVKAFEKSVLGISITEECGEGYNYTPNAQSNYISGASSFNNADVILDQTLKAVETKTDAATDKVNCITDEVKVFEKAVLGSQITEECGEGFTYTPDAQANYINSATSFTNADSILDRTLKVVENSANETSAKTDCMTNEMKALERAVLGNSITEECGEGFVYTPNPQTTYISGATSFDNADVLLDRSLSNLETKTNETSAKTDCITSEVKAFEKAVLGNSITEECGSGFVYTPNPQSNYINSATSFTNADSILDSNLKRIEDSIISATGDVTCVDAKTNKLYELLYGVGQTMPACGQGASYRPYVGACIISAATSFNEADQMLNDQICQILTMWVSGETCTTKSEWVQDGANKKIEVNAKVSRGNTGAMSDDDIFIENMSGDYIDPTNTEFTDTNALRIVCLTEGPSGTTPTVDSKQNGMYLSSAWDCGLYYSTTEADQAAKAQASAAGYKTDYNADEDASASGYNYMNNVR